MFFCRAVIIKKKAIKALKARYIFLKLNLNLLIVLCERRLPNIAAPKYKNAIKPKRPVDPAWGKRVIK